MTAKTPEATEAPEAPERGYRNFLNLDAILVQARAVADADGLDAISMRVLADRLGCTARALYRHVASKEAVLELLADRALAELPSPAPGTPWPDGLLEFFVAMRELLVASPAVAEIIATQPVAGPEFRRHADTLVRLLLAGGVDPALAAEAVVALAQFTLGASLPGTGQRLHEVYRTRAPERAPDARPSMKHLARHFGADAADVRFRSALARMIGGYRT